MKKDIETGSDIRVLVDTFYSRVREDNLLAPVFNEVIKDRWPEHLLKMYGFWETVLFGSPAYKGSPFPKHARLPVDQLHFDRWLMLFNQTLDDLFTGEKADEAKWRGGKMAEMFMHKIAYFKTHPEKLMS
ncbi:MAG: group III truncated hemoglobin [Bacteroidia bacterium]|nr:group III truncated hemoglobin [Bacteroidia bacterium]